MKPPLRFSLLGLFALVTIVALGVSLYLAQTRLAKAEAEVARLRQETGYLTIGDPSQVYVIAVPTTDAMHWRWRVYLPGGRDFAAYGYRGTFDAKGFPSQNSQATNHRMSTPHGPRELLLDVSLDKTLEGNACLRIRENGEGFSSIHFDAKLPTWLTDRMYSEQHAGKQSVLTGNLDMPLGLLRLDGIDGKGQWSDDAVLIWIAQHENPPDAAVKSLKDRGILPAESRRRSRSP